MKVLLQIILLLLFIGTAKAQITSPIIKANFGIEADLRANYFSNSILDGNDDWFNQSLSPFTGLGVIDTTGAAYIASKYSSDPSFRKLPFYRTMSAAPYSILNNKMWIDAVFSRDYHGSDSTMFAAGASKNGMSPQNWTCPVAQSVPDKNEILDMMVHVRRDGPNFKDSLWMFGGLSIENTTGDRYFDFEMYQTDIYYDRSVQKFYGYGPDAGHTSWQFDASGKVTVPGDIIFSAHYGSSTLSSIEARIWVDKAALLITPTAFSWNGTFDGAGAGAQYGYAGIVPKLGGVFYMGVESSSNTWAGPFQLVRGDNSVVTDYTAGQFMEFGVNLTKLGLDPVTLLGSDSCAGSFRKVLVKSRASTSFTAALKDFIGPFDFFLAPMAELTADTTLFCGHMGISQIDVTNPISTSVYTWTTPDGHINTYNSPTSILVDSAGTYIITQKLNAACADYATDTIVISTNPLCIVLQNWVVGLNGRLQDDKVLLQWKVAANSGIRTFEVERSEDGIHFSSIGQISNLSSPDGNQFVFPDYLNGVSSSDLYYRIRLTGNNNIVGHTKVISLFNGRDQGVSIVPNPVRNIIKLNITSPFKVPVRLYIYNPEGRQMMKFQTIFNGGNGTLEIKDAQQWPNGTYTINVVLGTDTYIRKAIILK